MHAEAMVEDVVVHAVAFAVIIDGGSSLGVLLLQP
jgi:hypothetical protein